MDDESFEQDTSQQNQEVNPWPAFGKNESNFDISLVKPHSCMQNIVPRTMYGQHFAHCIDGNHGIHIPHGKMLIKDANGDFDIVPIPLRDENGKIVAESFLDVVS